jgi:hypothetical protein
MSETPVIKATQVDPSLVRAPNVEALGMDRLLLVRGLGAKSTTGQKSASNRVRSVIINPYSSRIVDRCSVQC